MIGWLISLSNNESNFSIYIWQTHLSKATYKSGPTTSFSNEKMCHFSQFYIIVKSLPFSFWTLVQTKQQLEGFTWSSWNLFSILNNKSNSWLVKALIETVHTVVMGLISSGPLQSPPPFNPPLTALMSPCWPIQELFFQSQTLFFLKIILWRCFCLFWIGKHRNDWQEIGGREGKTYNKGLDLNLVPLLRTQPPHMNRKLYQVSYRVPWLNANGLKICNAQLPEISAQVQTGEPKTSEDNFQFSMVKFANHPQDLADGLWD